MVKHRDIEQAALTQSALVRRAFGEALARRREAKGWSQRSLSQTSSISNTHLRSIEAGKVSPSITTVFKIAETLEVEPSELLEDTQELLKSQKPRTSIDWLGRKR